MKPCPNCGYGNPPDAEFCNKCAARLVEGKDPFVGTVIDK